MSMYLVVFLNHLISWVSSYTEEEVKAFDAIMKLERGFNTVLSACAGDVRHLLALITKVNAYI
jgi:hypothetical protein